MSPSIKLQTIYISKYPVLEHCMTDILLDHLRGKLFPSYREQETYSVHALDSAVHILTCLTSFFCVLHTNRCHKYILEIESH